MAFEEDDIGGSLDFDERPGTIGDERILSRFVHSSFADPTKLEIDRGTTGGRLSSIFSIKQAFLLYS